MKTIKVILAFVIAGLAVLWAASSTQSHVYSGTTFGFRVEGGTVSMTNPSDQPVAAMLSSAGSRTFRVTSATEAMAGVSTAEGTGSGRSQTFALALPPGVSEFTTSGGSDVNFTADSGTALEAVVNPLSESGLRATLIAALIVVIVALFYASTVTQHPWLKMLRGKKASETLAAQELASATVNDGGQGKAMRSYGDNRAER